MPNFNLEFLKNLFREGITKTQFIEEYSKVFNASKEQASEEMSIFDDESDVVAAGLFDMLNTNKAKDGKEDVLDLEEINRFSNLSKADGENNMTEADANVLLAEYNKKVKKDYPIDAPEKMYENAKSKRGFNGDYAGTYLTVLHFQISDLDSLISIRQMNSNSAIVNYNNELNNLVQEDNSVSEKLKSKYQKENNRLNSLMREKAQLELEMKRKEDEISRANDECRNLQDNIDYATENDKDFSEYSSGLTSAQKKASKLGDGLSGLESRYSKVISGISKSEKALKSLQEEMASQSRELQSKMQAVNLKIESEKLSCNQDVQNYSQQRTSLERAQAYAVTQIQAEAQARAQTEAQSSGYSVDNGDDVYVYDEKNYDANAIAQLEQKWAKKAKKNGLDHNFFVKVTAIAQDLKCSPDDLLAVMNSESGINASARNPHGGATGLIQFMPSTAKSLGTTTDTLKNMSAYDQLDYVAKYLKNTKRSAGMGDKSMSAADVYSLIFLPGRANRDVLTSKGEAYYNWNTGLDMDGDGRISKADLNRRIRKFAA